MTHCTNTAILLLFIILCISISSAKKKDHYNPAHWMHDLKDTIYDESLLSIVLPGTHDSGAYQFSDTFSPLDSKIIDEMIKICADLGIDIYTFIKNWAITQNTTIYQQLNGGMRYVDLRACEIGTDWYTQHFLVGTRTQDLLNDIKRFMDENSGEIVVVEFGELVPFQDEMSLVAMIHDTLGKWLAPEMDLNKTTIGEMVDKNQRIIVLYMQSNLTQNYTYLWNKTLYMEGSYANMDKVADMEKWNLGQISTLGGDGLLFELSWTLTTQDSDIIKTLLDPYLRERTLRDFAIEANNALDAFAQKHNNYQLGNILLLDFWELSNNVQVAIDFNLRKCQDEVPWVAYDDSGLYCRRFYENKTCHASRYESWMLKHCKLSCGVC